MSDTAYEHLAALVKGMPAAQRALEHVWHERHNRLQPYHADSNPKETPVSDIRTELDALITKGEQDAAKLARYESEPYAAGLIGLLEAVPEARPAVTAVIDGLNAVAAKAAVAPETVAAATPQVSADQMPQTGVAS